MGFLAGWRMCPRCAGTLDADDRRGECAACGSVYYAHSAPAVSALVVDDEGRPRPEECAFRWVTPFLAAHAPTGP